MCRSRATPRCFIDCYKLDGTLVWRLDMGQNIRAGAHYTQFMVYDFNGDGRAEMAVKTAPGTVMTRFAPDGTVLSRRYITMPQKDLDAGYSHADNYVCTAQDYRLHMAEVFRRWHTHPEVVNGRWPVTVEQCFGLTPQYAYPLCRLMPLRWPTISLMCTRRAAAPKTSCAGSRALSMTAPST